MPGLGFILERKAQNRKGRIFNRTLDLVPSTDWAALTGAAGVVHASWGQHLPLASWFPQQWPQQVVHGGEKGGRGLDPRSAPRWAACGARLSASTLQPALWSQGSEGRIWPTHSAGKKKKQVRSLSAATTAFSLIWRSVAFHASLWLQGRLLWSHLQQLCCKIPQSCGFKQPRAKKKK